MLRLTRAESQARTRELLVSTARELFLRDGYQATSLEQVAEAAGFSKGAVYSNFRTKDELCLAAIDAISEREMTEMADRLCAAATVDGQLRALAGWANRVLGDDGLTALLVELGMQGRKNGRLRAELVAREDAVRDAIERAVESTVRRFGVRPRLPHAQFASVVYSLAVGIGLTRALDPQVRTESLVDAIRSLVDE